MSDDKQYITAVGLRSLASTYEQNARRCREIGEYLKRQTVGMFWQSNAARSFQENMGHYQQVLANFEADFLALSRDLRSRAELLEQSSNV